MCSRAGLNARKISSPPRFNTEPSSPWSVTILIELPVPLALKCFQELKLDYETAFHIVSYCVDTFATWRIAALCLQSGTVPCPDTSNDPSSPSNSCFCSRYV